jgi:hypothetical protein
MAHFMVKKSIMYRGVCFEDLIENYLNRERTSICQFLHFLCRDDISQYLENVLCMPTTVGIKNIAVLQ